MSCLVGNLEDRFSCVEAQKVGKMSSLNAYYSCLKEMIMSVLKVDPQGLPILYNPPSLILHCFRILFIYCFNLVIAITTYMFIAFIDYLVIYFV